MDLNTAVITSIYITKQHLPILEVYNDEGWEFLGGQMLTEKDVQVISLGQILEIDPTVGGILDLPTGWKVVRNSINDEWVRSRI